MISEKEVYDIYEKHILINYNNEYVNKYVPLPFELNNGNWKWENKDFPRVISLLEFREYMKEFEVFENILTFSRTPDPEIEFIKYKNVHNYCYEENRKYDLHCLDLDKKDFDFVILNQTAEHLYNPLLSFQNIYKYLKNNGIAYFNVPSNSLPHDTPYHYYTGITPSGLAVLVKLAGFDILKIGQWGNKEYMRKSLIEYWPDYTFSSNPGHNDMDFPIITWCLAIKNEEV
jgi:SAM-dependent methyltransferase